MNRLQKEQCISDMRNSLQGQSLVVVATQNKVTVAESTKLRREMRNEGAQLKVLKNTLLRIAVTGTTFEGLKSMFSGMTVLAYSQDPVGAARVVAKFAEEHEGKLSIVGAWLDGQVLAPASVFALAKLPSLLELRGKLVGLLQAPATKVVRTIKEPMGRVARVLAARS
ncbi:MAG: 50S ribosomal protein L10 [Holosporales bacterium]|jgi:large subunit ribosomal protein L10|nr:50S ribosomal protein L10 [Holosporales bacterium]